MAADENDEDRRSIVQYIVSSFPHVSARARSPAHLLAVLHMKASEVNLGEHLASVVGRNHRTQGNDESAYLDESCYMLGSVGFLTHIACNLHSHEPLSGFPAALARPILSAQPSSF